MPGRAIMPYAAEVGAQPLTVWYLHPCDVAPQKKLEAQVADLMRQNAKLRDEIARSSNKVGQELACMCAHPLIRHLPRAPLACGMQASGPLVGAAMRVKRHVLGPAPVPANTPLPTPPLDLLDTSPCLCWPARAPQSPGIAAQVVELQGQARAARAAADKAGEEVKALENLVRAKDKEMARQAKKVGGLLRPSCHDGL